VGIQKIDNALSKKIALRLKELRKSRGVTQLAVYEDLGIHIGRIETGRNDLSISTIKKICDYFEIELSEFFKGI
jgi:transcriptional regulator with XRE-family HTH domain